MQTSATSCLNLKKRCAKHTAIGFLIKEVLVCFPGGQESAGMPHCPTSSAAKQLNRVAQWLSRGKKLNLERFPISSKWEYRLHPKYAYIVNCGSTALASGVVTKNWKLLEIHRPKHKNVHF